ncbi:hypothetical protein [Streptomyces sp. NPDC007905]|uniref:hypothetical protein n=1 Tax=Streptomyces sp. NPDC007905 TaxID=3364788 RepID=UPI0036EB24FE
MAAVLLAGLVVVATSGTRAPAEHVTSLTVVLLAATLGWRNRGMLQAGIPDRPTTVLQVSFVKAPWTPCHAARPRPENRGCRARRLATVFGVFVGGVAGALLPRLGSGPLCGVSRV